MPKKTAEYEKDLEPARQWETTSEITSHGSITPVWKTIELESQTLQKEQLLLKLNFAEIIEKFSGTALSGGVSGNNDEKDTLGHQAIRNLQGRFADDPRRIPTAIYRSKVSPWHATCSGCGEPRTHARDKCKNWKTTCNLWKRNGHDATVCRSSQKGFRRVPIRVIGQDSGSRHVFAVIDTSLELSMVSHRFLTDHKGIATLDATEWVDLIVQISEEKLSFSFRVVEGMFEDVILADNFLRHFGAVMNYKSNTVTFEQGTGSLKKS